MRVLMMVQEVNETHWLRGFTVGWIQALAAEVEQLHVLTLEQHAAILPANVQVHSMGKEQGKNRGRELRRFYQVLREVVPSIEVIFSHMTPRYTWLAAPYAWRYHKPQLLWYTHPKISPELRLATACAKWIATADVTSFPLPSAKVHALGHGIDISRFNPDPQIDPTTPPMILAVGRMTPAKHHHILLEATGLLKKWGVAVRCVVVGAPAAKGDAEYQAALLSRRAALGLTETDFSLMGGLPSDDLITYTQGVTAITNLSPLGYFDKAALEGMLLGKPLITANPAFLPLLGEYAARLKIPRHDDAYALAIAIQELLALTSEERQQMGLSLRAHTAQAHGLQPLMARLVQVMSGENIPKYPKYFIPNSAIWDKILD